MDPSRPGRLLSHRVVGRDALGRVLTRGDANAAADSTPVPPTDVRGVGRLMVPLLGRPLVWSAHRQWLPLLGWLLVTGIAVHGAGGALTRGSPVRRRAVLATLAVLTPVAVPPHAVQTTSAAFVGATSSPGETFALAAGAQFGPSSYAAQIGADNPAVLWSLDESSGATAANTGSSGSAANGIYASGVTLGTTPDASPREGGTAVTLNGVSGCVRDPLQVVNPQVLTLELWFSTTTTSGGKLFGLAKSTDTSSAQYDRHIYMTSAGRLVFGTFSGSTFLVESAASYNDGRWHLVTATIGPAGMVLYVDGAAVASGTNTASENYNGYWRIGGDRLGGQWTNTPATATSSGYFAGQLDAAAVYYTQLSAARVSAHWFAA